MRNGKHAILKALFSEAKRLGIDQETLRDDITPGVINKRLRAATPQEIAKVLVYIHHRHGVPEPTPNPSQEGNMESPLLGGDKGVGRKQYESSRAGLLQEIKDLAIARFGQDFVRPLNALCECFKVEGYRSLRVNQAKAVKATLIRLQREDPRNPPPLSPSEGGQLEGASEGGQLKGISEGGDISPAGGGAGGGGRDTERRVLKFQKGRKGFFGQL